MNKKLQIYKIKKLNRFLCKKKFFFFCHVTASNYENRTEIERILTELCFEHYKIQNSIIKCVIKNSIFNKFIILLGGPAFLITLKAEKNIKSIIKLNRFYNYKQFFIICIRINNKIYKTNQIYNYLMEKYLKSCFVFILFLFYNTIKRCWSFKPI